MIHVPTAPYATIGVLIIPRYRKTLICVATCPASLAAMQATARESDTNYRLSWHDDLERHLTRHESRERGVVTSCVKDHRPVDREARLHELEATTYEPMDEWRAA